MFDHFWDFDRLVEDETPKRNGDRGISPPFVVFLGFRVDVMGMRCQTMGLPMFRPLL
jgi:hypothetical protein